MELAQKILNILIEQGDVSSDVAEEIRVAATSTESSVLDIIRKRHLITEEKLLMARAKALKVPFITLTGMGISPDLLNYIPEPVARKYKIIPFDTDKNTGRILIAMTDPLNLPLIEFLQQKSGKTVSPYLALESEIISKIDEEYAHGLGLEVSEAIKETTAGTVRTIQAEDIGKIIKEAPIAKIVTTFWSLR